MSEHRPEGRCPLARSWNLRNILSDSGALRLKPDTEDGVSVELALPLERDSRVFHGFTCNIA